MILVVYNLLRTGRIASFDVIIFVGSEEKKSTIDRINLFYRNFRRDKKKVTL